MVHAISICLVKNDSLLKEKKLVKTVHDVGQVYEGTSKYHYLSFMLHYKQGIIKLEVKVTLKCSPYQSFIRAG